MMRRTVLLVTVLAAAALAFAPIALATPVPELEELPTLVPIDERLLPQLNVSADGVVQADVAPIVKVTGGASVTVRTDDSEVPMPVDGAADAAHYSPDVDAPAPVASFAAATAAVGLLALLALGIEAVRVAASSAWAHVGRIVRATARFALLVPLFSRISRADLLENRVRASIHAAVTENPGLSLTEVQSCTGIAWGTAVHHLQRLEKEGMVVSATQRAHRRYFVAGTPAAMRRNDIAVMVHPTARRIATLVSKKPGIDQTGICQALGLNNPAASKHLRGFEAQGLVLSQRDGRKRLYHPTPSLDAALPFVMGLRSASTASDHPPVVQLAPTAALG